MTNMSKRTLYWTPRLLSIVFILFLSMFALDVFGESHGFWATLLALTMHLIPQFVLIAALILAWRWEWIGAVIYGAGGMAYIFFALSRPWLPSMKLICILMIAGPAFAVAVLFLVNWLKHGELHLQPELHTGHP